MGLICILLSLFILSLHAEPIPLFESQNAATDLVYKNSPTTLSPEQALKLKQQLDISTLEPETTSYYDGKAKDLNQKNKALRSIDLSSLTLTEFPNYQTLDLTQLIAQDSTGKKYYIYFGPKSHNILLRNGLLAKAGYVTQPAVHQLKLKIKTKSASDAIGFLQRLQLNLIFKNTNRWVTNINRTFQDEEWVWKYNKNSDQEIILQDVIITPVSNETFDLDYGFVPPQIIDNYRSLNSLLLFYSLVEVPESINKFSPQPGNIIDKKLYLDYSLMNPDFDFFTPTFEDAKWSVRKLSKLNRADFEQIVQQIHYPNPDIEKLLIEKLISRRNWLTNALLADEKINTINTNLNFTSTLVKNGVISKSTEYSNPNDVLDPNKWYVGYGSRFSFQQKEAPISWEQIQSYLWTLLSTNLQSNIVQQINKELPQTNLEKKSIVNTVDYQIDSFFNCVLTSQCDPKTDYWNTPFFKFKLLSQRAVQFGSVFGTNNQIQLVEEFGFGMDAGVFFSTLGLDAGTILNAQIDAGYLRRWTHIKPLASIKQTLQSEYHYKIIPKLKGLFVPYSQYKLGHSLRDLSNESIHLLDTKMQNETGNIDELKLSEQQEVVDTILKDFTSTLSIGQSFIVTDQISFGAGVNFGKKLSDNWQLKTSAGTKLLDLARMHIHRPSENKIQIYITKTKLNKSELNMNLSLYIPVLSAYWGHKNSVDLNTCLSPKNENMSIIKQSEYITKNSSSCSPITYFYELDIQSSASLLKDLQKETLNIDDLINNTQHHTQKLIQHLKLISRALTNNSIAKTQRQLDKIKISQKVQHNFKETTSGWSLLSKQWFNATTTDHIDIEVTQPAHEVSKDLFSEDDLIVQRKQILHYKTAHRSGNNYQKLLTDVANWFIEDKLEDQDVNISVPNNGNPGDSIYGHSTQRKLSLDALIEDNFVLDPIYKIQLNHKGWKLNFKETIELVEKLNSKFGPNFINPKYFYGMSEYQLYQIQVQHIIFSSGVEYLITKKPEFFEDLFQKANIKLLASELKNAHDKYINLDEALKDKKRRAYIRFKIKSKKLFKAFKYKRIKDFKVLSIEMIDFLDSLFDFEDLNLFFGKTKDHSNSYVYANLSGFKKGLENSVEDIQSIHLGEVGQLPLSGASDYFRKEHLNNMSPGEFYMTWILEAY